MSYTAANSRYDSMQYRRCGRSGVLLPAISLGLWHNFGGVDALENCRSMLHRAFDLGHHAFRPGEQLRAAYRDRRRRISGASCVVISRRIAMS